MTIPTNKPVQLGDPSAQDDNSNPNNPYQIARREWPDGRQLSFTVFNMPYETSDGTIAYHKLEMQRGPLATV